MNKDKFQPDALLFLQITVAYTLHRQTVESTDLTSAKIFETEYRIWKAQSDTYSQVTHCETWFWFNFSLTEYKEVTFLMDDTLEVQGLQCIVCVILE